MALGVPESDVTSPTFVLMHEYQTQPQMVHIDAYRIADEDEFYEIGARRIDGNEGVIIVEWEKK